MENYLEIGQIVNTHGLRGDLKVMPWCDDPEIFDELAYVVIDGVEFDIEKSRMQKNMVLLKLEGIDHINDADKYRNKVLTIPREELGELPEGTYYICDLLGCSVETVDGKNLGKVCDIIKTGSNDVYVVEDDSKKQVLIPVIDEVVKSVDIEGKQIIIEPLKGLID
ncbi:MAG: 16S rRNA processing protein RimM [Ruminococcaceae bacterium]|nr:16S rRNA processing protein RimM [Oscillospiraceae bacterium]